jgi:DNA-binding LytR/AlgR family response regulator
VKNHKDLDLLSFITFIMTHELLHVHRFSTGLADFFGSPHDEEIVVDALTRVFLAKNPVIGLKKVLALLDKLEAAPLYNNHIMHDGGRCFYAYL